mgnify:CR=1 FL=1|tara:strand:- start:943 stop:1200 length:258 start_codon:yes stop_codon:yes gene_type:complete
MKIDNDYHLAYDENNVMLIYEQNRIRKKKSGAEEPYTYQEVRYYPNVKSALKAYVNQKLKGSESIKDILSKIDKIELTIENIEIK